MSDTAYSHPWQANVLSVLRIVAGLLFLQHGLMKLFGFPAPFPGHVVGLYLVAGLIETIGGILVCVGLLTRPAAFIMSGEMAFAYFMSHAPKAAFPVLNGGELAILYCFAFLYLAFAGGGAWSLDRVIAGPRSWLAGPLAGPETA
ncbi:MAG TPA: DoxX family protein [Acetobacteraceae bacterium]|nr:DoxX family protein [Acetobacteraceae bacterium]